MLIEDVSSPFESDFQCILIKNTNLIYFVDNFYKHNKQLIHLLLRNIKVWRQVFFNINLWNINILYHTYKLNNYQQRNIIIEERTSTLGGKSTNINHYKIKYVACGSRK